MPPTPAAPRRLRSTGRFALRSQRPSEVSAYAVPLEYCPVAVNCWVPPGARDTDAGETAIELRAGAVTAWVCVAEVRPEALAVITGESGISSRKYTLAALCPAGMVTEPAAVP